MSKRKETSSIPATYILDKPGSVISEHIGIIDNSNDKFVKQLNNLANGDGAGK